MSGVEKLTRQYLPVGLLFRRHKKAPQIYDLQGFFDKYGSECWDRTNDQLINSKLAYVFVRVLFFYGISNSHRIGNKS